MGFHLLSQHFVTCWLSLLPTTSLSFFLSLALPCGLLVWLGSPVPKQPDQLCNDLVVMCYEIQIQIAGFIFVFWTPKEMSKKRLVENVVGSWNCRSDVMWCCPISRLISSCTKYLSDMLLTHCALSLNHAVEINLSCSYNFIWFRGLSCFIFVGILIVIINNSMLFLSPFLNLLLLLLLLLSLSISGHNKVLLPDVVVVVVLLARWRSPSCFGKVG